MNKRIYILFFVLGFSTTLLGQFVGKDNVSVALFYLQKSELDSAKKYVDKATMDEELKDLPKTWYYRGYIHKEIYKEREKEDKKSPSRVIAIESLKKLLNIDEQKEFTESTRKILNYLASTYYNDAARSLTPQEYADAQQNYRLFHETMVIASPGIDMKDQDIKFKLALASIFNRLAENIDNMDSLALQRAKEIYEEVLVLDTNNATANYNLAILYYNEGVDIINKMDYDMDLEQLNSVQDKCIVLFLKALPYMKKSHDLQWKRKETLIGLSNIYYGLNDMEKSEFYKKELQGLENGK